MIMNAVDGSNNGGDDYGDNYILYDSNSDEGWYEVLVAGDTGIFLIGMWSCCEEHAFLSVLEACNVAREKREKKEED